MTTVTASPPTAPALDASESAPASLPRGDQWHAALGYVPLHRIVFNPPPGTATAEDVVRLAEAADKRLVELVNGTLVEKAVGFKESVVGGNVLALLHHWAMPQRRGVVAGEQGMIRMLADNIRMPDVAFVRHEDLPGGRIPDEPAPRLAPTLAVEVLSQSNTDEEMHIKVKEYFDSGVRVVWILQPEPADAPTLRVYDSPDRFAQLTKDDTLDGGEFLPGFTARVGDFFAA